MSFDLQNSNRRCIYQLEINKIMNVNNKPTPFGNQEDSHPKMNQTQSKEKTIFGSRVQRFVFQPKETPGPGTYEFNIKEKHTQDYRVVKDKKDGIAIEHQWIFSNGRLSIPNSYSNIGPGLYEQSGLTVDASHSNWQKKERFNETKSYKNSLGPGQYQNLQEKQIKRDRFGNFSVFKSRSPRTFFEELIKKEKKLQMQTNPEEIQVNDTNQEVIKFDETAYPVRKKIEKLSPVFLSKCERPQLINDNSPAKLGPGSYSLNVQKLTTQKSTGIISAMHYNTPLQEQKKPYVLTSKVTPPGPGTYLTESTPIESTKKKPLGIMPKEERFKANQSLTKDTLPGPGQYMQNRYTMIKEDDIVLKNKNSFIRKAEKMHDFGTVGRTTLRNPNAAPFGQYNVQLFDMNYKVLKQKQHYEKLKMMEVTLPAFNSKQHN